MARDLSSLYSSQPSPSPSHHDEEAVERAFWQSTPTALELLRQGADDACHRALSGDDRDRPEYDPLCLSAQQSRLVRQTWTSPPAASTARSPDGDRRTSPRSEHRQRGARLDSTVITADLRPDNSIFRHLESIEKAVDERMRKRKIQKEWSARMIAETARLIRDEAGLGSMHDTFDNHYLRTSQPMEQVPTSQSQERYIHLSPMAPTGNIDARCVPIDDDAHVDMAGNLCDIARSECRPVGGPAALSGPSNWHGRCLP